MRRKVITIGIPCYQNAPAETLEDYMRFAYYLGRRYTEYDFFLAIKAKSEQFRARNAIVEAALQVGSDYLFFLDDDQVIDWENAQGPSVKYDFLRTMIAHLEADPTRGIVGALYFMRGGECKPVAMKQGGDGGYYFLRDEDLTGTLQEVAVAGGGAMLINTNVFSRIAPPWFHPELDLGTDIQICKKAKEEGFSVWLDSSIEFGHVMSAREVITSKNRHFRKAAYAEGVDTAWKTSSAVGLYMDDAQEYLGMTLDQVFDLAAIYNEKNLSIAHALHKDGLPLDSYYRNLGPEQLARQVWYHSQPTMVTQAEQVWKIFDGTGKNVKILDYGCGSAPVSFELVMRGHTVDFVDLEGAPAYAFTKWRAHRRGVEKRCGWNVGEHGPYECVTFFDSLEHLANWREVLAETVSHLVEGGCIVTNYFSNNDYGNPEHISMDKKAVEQHLVSIGLYPQTPSLWIKQRIVKEEAA